LGAIDESTLGAISGSLDSLNNRMDAADARLDNLDNRVSALGQFARDSRREARRGIVASAATAPVMMPSGPGRTTVNIKAAGYRGEAGVGITFAHRLNTARPVVLNAGYSNGGGREHIGHAGVGFEF
jgi:autotransporter adhesin